MSFFRHCYISPRRGCPKVMKFCMRPWVTKIIKLYPWYIWGWTVHIRNKLVEFCRGWEEMSVGAVDTNENFHLLIPNPFIFPNLSTNRNLCGSTFLFHLFHLPQCFPLLESPSLFEASWLFFQARPSTYQSQIGSNWFFCCSSMVAGWRRNSWFSSDKIVCNVHSATKSLTRWWR